jgi:hypothetical protein
LTLNTNEFCIFAAIIAERVAPGGTCEKEQAEAPENGYRSYCFSGDISGVFSAGGAWGPITTASLISQINDHGALLNWCGGRRWIVGRWRGSAVSGSTIAGSGISVHFPIIIITRIAIKS